jgi:putative zinc finger/helix-turn-helix YgiT family protein
MKMTCPICGTGQAKQIKKAYRTMYDGQPVSLPKVEMFRCAECQEEFFNPEQAQAVSVEVKNTVRRLSGLLPPERILAIREKVHLTQSELERLFGQGPKVVTRWESGRVIQSKTADTILRMLEKDPDIILSLLKKVEKNRGQAQRKQAQSEAPEMAAAR